MINIENFNPATYTIAVGYMDRFVDPKLRLQDHTVQSCPGTAFTKLMVDCMNREPKMSGS
jgi:hypothetical protein